MNVKVLLVDDEEEFVKALAERLRMRELGPVVAFNGEQALQIVQDQTPDVIVLDLRMPGMDGLDVLRQVRMACPEVQVIILTAHGSERDEETARQLGVFAYLKKPVDLNKLVDTLKRAHRQQIEDSKELTVAD